MMIFSEPTTQIDHLLDKMAESIQLDDSRYDRMKSAYNALKDWIESDDAFFGPYKYDVYPHGSVRTLTTNKPLKSDEFDLDVAIHLIAGTIMHTPARIYAELKRRLMEHGKYRTMIEPKNRCIRINYAGDFHIDVLPGVQENIYDRDKIKVPDRELGHWVSSNPRGYAKWFIDRANSVEISLIEKALRAENIPVDNYKYKKPLQRSVQLLKRYRDVYFQDNDEFKTSSIIITTLAGQLYNGEDSIFATIDNIVFQLNNRIAVNINRFKVLNPVNNDEDFTDKWDTDSHYYSNFIGFCKQLKTEWQKLKSGVGRIQESQILKGLFGNDAVIKAEADQIKFIDDLRNANNLGMNRESGILQRMGAGAAMSQIKSNTFYGGGHD